MPLYGIVHDSPVITAVQKIKPRKAHIQKIHENDSVGRLFAPLLAKIQEAVDKVEEEKNNKKK